MKKIIAIVLALTVLFAFAACGGDKTPTDANTQSDAAVAVDVTTLITKLYEANPVEFPAMTDGVEIDLADADSVKAYTGLDSAEGVEKAYFSESMMNAQAYSLVVLKLADADKAEETKQAMLDGINLRKWICAEANCVRVVSAGDVIMFVMINTELSATLADDMVTAFEAIAGSLSGETLKVDNEI